MSQRPRVYLPALAAMLGLLIIGVVLPGRDPAGARSRAARAVRAASGCHGKAAYAIAVPPRRIFGNTYDVGTCGITALLVTSPAGNILIDGGIAKAAPLVAASITRLGFRLADIRWIVASHEHYDHVGALAELHRRSGAPVAALAAQAAALRSGSQTADDPEYKANAGFPPVPVARILRDGEEVVSGAVRLTPHATPVHAPGSTSWTWQSCEGAICRDMAYADSVRILSDDDYRFTNHPERVAQARAGLAVIAALPCDIIITPHPDVSSLTERLAGKLPLVDPSACRRYARHGAAGLDKRLRAEHAAGPAGGSATSPT